MLRPAAESPIIPRAEGRAGEEWAVVVPAKSLDKAKSRMTADLSDPARRDLVRAMLQDVIAAATATPMVSVVVVVTADEDLSRLASSAGARVLAEFADSDSDTASGRTAPAGSERTVPDVSVVPGGDRTYRRAAALGLSWARTRYGRVAVLASDLPGLTKDELSAALAAAAAHVRGYVADADGTGTTLATFTAADASAAELPTFFGTDSAREFAASGAHRMSDVMGWGGLSRDVDSVAHLTDLAYLGQRTRRVVDSWLADGPHARGAVPLGKLKE